MKKLWLLALAGILFMTSEASAGIIIGTTPANGVSYLRFTTTGGAASFNLFAYGFAGGPNGSAFWDSMVYLAHDNGSPIGALTGVIWGANDDSSTAGWNSDGSTTTLDSFLNVNLAAGNYIFGVGQYFFTETEFRSGISDAPGSPRDYQLTYSGVELVTAVPVPSSVVMACIGVCCIGIANWRSRVTSRKLSVC